MYKIAICDDDKIQLDYLEKTIRKSELFEARNTEIHQFKSGTDLIKVVCRGMVYDYIFLDINMPEKTGLQTYKEMKITLNTKVIFVSTHAEKLPEIFALRMPHFLYKPYDVDTFCRTIRAIQAQYEKEYIFTYIEDDREYTVSSKKIRYIHVCNHDIFAITDKIIRLSRSSLDALTDILELYGFFRCHRSFLINYDYYKKHDNTHLYLSNGKKEIQIPLSREKKKIITGALLKYKMTGDSYGD